MDAHEFLVVLRVGRAHAGKSEVNGETLAGLGGLLNVASAAILPSEFGSKADRALGDGGVNTREFGDAVDKIVGIAEIFI